MPIKNFSTYLFFFALILLAACNNQEEPLKDTLDTNTIKLDYHNPRLSDMPDYKKIRLVPLETNDGSLIGGINKILTTNNYIYILDTFSAEAVFVFDNNGKLIKTIKTVGRGPSEYVMITDIGFDPYNKELVLVDPQLRKVLRYDEKGKFKTETYFDFGPNMIGFLDGKTYAFKTNTKSGPVIKTIQHDGQNEKIVHSLTFELNLSNFFYLPNYQGNQFFFENLKDTIWRITPERMEPYIFIDFMDRKLSPEDYQDLILDTRKNRRIPFLPKNKAGQVDVYLETQKYLQFFCRNIGNRTLVLIDKKDSSILNLANSSNHRQNPMAQIIYSVNTVDPNGNFVGYIPADRYLDLIEANKFKELTSSGVIMIENSGFNKQSEVKITSNPLIAFLTI